MIERMTLKLVDDWPRHPLELAIDGVTYRVEGECNHCGDCCRGPGVPYPGEDGNCRELRKNLDDHGVETWKCNIYVNRPMWCLVYPCNPAEPLPERCGFRWVV